METEKLYRERLVTNMRKVKIVADSSANLLKLERVAFASVSLKIITAGMNRLPKN